MITSFPIDIPAELVGKINDLYGTDRGHILLYCICGYTPPLIIGEEIPTMCPGCKVSFAFIANIVPPSEEDLKREDYEAEFVLTLEDMQETKDGDVEYNVTLEDIEADSTDD